MGTRTLEELSELECLRLLGSVAVGRLAVVDCGFPVVVPVNYRTVGFAGRTWFAVRTRAGNMLDQGPGSSVALEIDGADTANRTGWSVLVRGALHYVSADVVDIDGQFNPRPFLNDDRDAWLAIEPFEISGRRIHGDPETLLDDDSDGSGGDAEMATLDRTEALRLLSSTGFGQLSLTLDGLPSVVPVRYIAGKERVLIHVASGRDPDVIRDGEIVGLYTDAFETDRRTGWSVLVTGAVAIPDSEEMRAAARAPWLGEGGSIIAVSTDVIWGQMFTPRHDLVPIEPDPDDRNLW